MSEYLIYLIEQLKEDLRTMSVVKVGEKYGVSDNAIRKWIKVENCQIAKLSN